MKEYGIFNLLTKHGYNQVNLYSAFNNESDFILDLIAFGYRENVRLIVHNRESLKDFGLELSDSRQTIVAYLSHRYHDGDGHMAVILYPPELRQAIMTYKLSN